MQTRATSYLLLCWLGLIACTSQPPDRAHAIEQRLLAPCCWRESLVDHQSGIADELRAEIRARVANGDADGAIEGDLVARFGDRIRVEPAGSLVGAAIAGLVVTALVMLIVWTRRRRVQPSSSTAIREEDEADRARLDDELFDA